MSLTKLNGATFSEGQNNARALLASPARNICIYGGARSGKTFLILRGIVHRALRAEGSRHAALRFRYNAARASISLDTLPNVVARCFPGLECKEHRQDGFFQLPNKSQIWVGGLDDKERVEKILGQEYATIYLNEASQIPYSSVLVAQTRLAQVCEGLKQRFLVDLNPVGRSHWTNAMFVRHVDPQSGRALPNPEDYISGRLNPKDNAHNLDPAFLATLDALPEKQRKRFFEGLYVDEIENALWTSELLENGRVDDLPEAMWGRTIIGVDPSGASGEDTTADDIGIIAATKGADGHGYVVEDASMLGAPAKWAKVAVDLYHKHKADCIVAERNFGGEMVRAVLQGIDKNVPVTLVTASKGKHVRAEPIAALYEKNKIHHVGRFAKLEEQLCAFSTVGYTGADSPDHADAAVWALSELMLEEEAPTAQSARYKPRWF